MPPAGKLRIVVADDHEVVRRGVRALLEQEPGWEVAGEAATGRETVELVKELKPDVVVLDLSMPELNGLEATRQIRKAVPDAEVVILSFHDSEQLVREVLKAGARGYVLKSDALRSLVAAVQSLRDHKPFFSSGVSQLVLDGYLHSAGAGAEGDSPAGRLTQREREILQLLAEGKTHKEVARTLKIAVKTVEAHRTSIMSRLGLHSLGDLIRYAIRNQIVEL